MRRKAQQEQSSLLPQPLPTHSHMDHHLVLEGVTRRSRSERMRKTKKRFRFAPAPLYLIMWPLSGTFEEKSVEELITSIIVHFGLSNMKTLLACSKDAASPSEEQGARSEDTVSSIVAASRILDRGRSQPKQYGAIIVKVSSNSPAFEVIESNPPGQQQSNLHFRLTYTVLHMASTTVERLGYRTKYRRKEAELESVLTQIPFARADSFPTANVVSVFFSSPK